MPYVCTIACFEFYRTGGDKQPGYPDRQRHGSWYERWW
jgi:hypothetical protein